MAAVYCMYSKGGGAASVAEAFDTAGRACRAFIVHDLHPEHAALLRSGRISAVLHHDLEQDLRLACQVVLQAQRALPGTVRTWPSAVLVLTPFNPPGRPGLTRADTEQSLGQIRGVSTAILSQVGVVTTRRRVAP